MEVYSWSDIIQFYNIDKKKVPRLAPKLKDQHIQLPPFSPMRVCLATQTFSHTVSSAMFTLISNNLMNSKALYTAKFMKIIDDLFDVFNSCSFDEPKIFRKPLTINSKHWICLNVSYEILTKLEIQNANKKNSHHVLVAGFQILIPSVKMLRLTQDCVKSLFSVVRAKGGNNVAPDSSKFYSAIRMCVTQQLLVPLTSGNCEIEACEFLTKCNDLLKNKQI
ncbi:hypothetical protein AGLY_017821 [Aphis glycines]|uniref:Transposable element P transposase-like GTP-binding insertion domain-containing protein n=1 Tax=Aphis glycines TaxID=307491 RepID=A0A6G0STQ1_APHGL|nr:hypothetical protein AGLY_017821 [Aphis glycines]